MATRRIISDEIKEAFNLNSFYPPEEKKSHAQLRQRNKNKYMQKIK